MINISNISNLSKLKYRESLLNCNYNALQCSPSAVSVPAAESSSAASAAEYRSKELILQKNMGPAEYRSEQLILQLNMGAAVYKSEVLILQQNMRATQTHRPPGAGLPHAEICSTSAQFRRKASR